MSTNRTVEDYRRMYATLKMETTEAAKALPTPLGRFDYAVVAAFAAVTGRAPRTPQEWVRGARSLQITVAKEVDAYIAFHEEIF